MNIYGRIKIAGAAIVMASGMVLGFGMVGSGTAQADTQSYGTGTWNMKNPSTFKIPANWRCGATVRGGSTSYGQACIVRSGNYVQGALIIRNRTNSNLAMNARPSMFDVGTSSKWGHWNLSSVELGTAWSVGLLRRDCLQAEGSACWWLLGQRQLAGDRLLAI